MTMNSPQALVWLKERTVSEINRLLESWSPTQIEHDGHTFALIKRAGCVFGSAFGSKDTIFDVMLHAMALAIAAGEMEIDAIEKGAVPRVGSLCPIKRVEVSGRQRACFRAMGHEDDHEDTLGRWYELGAGPFGLTVILARAR